MKLNKTNYLYFGLLFGFFLFFLISSPKPASASYCSDLGGSGALGDSCWVCNPVCPGSCTEGIWDCFACKKSVYDALGMGSDTYPSTIDQTYPACSCNPTWSSWQRQSFTNKYNATSWMDNRVCQGLTATCSGVDYCVGTEGWRYPIEGKSYLDIWNNSVYNDGLTLQNFYSHEILTSEYGSAYTGNGYDVNEYLVNFNLQPLQVIFPLLSNPSVINAMTPAYKGVGGFYDCPTWNAANNSPRTCGTQYSPGPNSRCDDSNPATTDQCVAGPVMTFNSGTGLWVPQSVCVTDAYTSVSYPPSLGFNDLILSTDYSHCENTTINLCGNGVLDAGETCDTALSYSAVACGSGACTGTQTRTCNACTSFTLGTCSSSGSVCTAATQCTNAALCDTVGVCPAVTNKVNGAVCNDSNVCTSPDTCTSGVCSGPNTCNVPDLVTQDLTFIGNLVAGSTLGFSGTVRNSGLASAGAVSQTRLRIDRDTNGTWDVLPANQSTSDLSAGATEVETWANAWANVPVGIHLMEVCADVTSVVAESNELNNCYSFAFNVTAAVVESCTGMSGYVRRDYWSGIAGVSISDLTSNANYPNSPTSFSQPANFEAPTNVADNYGAKMYGLVKAPATGSYTFYIASDDASELWLSTTASSANKVLRAYVTGWTNSREWTKYVSQTSASVNLTAGQTYYIEALHKEGGGGDNLAVGWRVPGSGVTNIIPSSCLSPYSSCTSLTYQSASSGFSTNQSATAPFSANLSVTPGSTFYAFVDYSATTDAIISPNVSGSYTCVWETFVGTVGRFRCTAPSSAAVYTYTTGTIAGTASNTCASGPTAMGTVTVASVAPAITLSPTTMTFSGTSGGSAPTAQTFTVRNSGSAGSTLKWRATTNQSWCFVNGVGNGTYFNGADLSAGATSPNLSVTMSAPSNAGSFSCTVTVSDNGSSPAASNSPQTLTATYTVKPSNVSSVTASLAVCPSRVVTISWTAASSGATAKTYTIYRSTTNNSATATAIASNVVATTYADSPTTGSTYYYWVETVSGGQVSPNRVASVPASLNVAACGAPPVESCTGMSGYITRNYWSGIGGMLVTDLTSNANYPNSPTSSSQPASFEAPTNIADNYGTRMYGLIKAPATGSYLFYIASDDYSDLYLSTNTDPANKVKIASVVGWTNSREWTKYAGQTSALINLTADQTYYIEAIHKEGTGGDNLAVGWRVPNSSTTNVVPGSCLGPYVSVPAAPGGGTSPDPGGYNPNSINPPGGGSVACEYLRLAWTDNSTNETGFKIYKDGVYLTTVPASSPASATGGVLTYEFNPGDLNAHSYAIAATGAGGDSAQVALQNNPVSTVACVANLTTSDKDIVAINGNNILANQCGGTDALPVGTQLNLGDKVKFSINLCNSGTEEASGITVTDYLTNLIMPTAGWNAKYDSGSGEVSIASVGITLSVSGTAPNQILTFTNVPNVPIPGDPPPSIRRITFEAQLSIPANFIATSARFQNSFAATYNAGTVNKHTPLILFFTGQGVPIIIEVP